MNSSREAPVRRRILIVDKQPLIRRGLSSLIDNTADLTVCASVATLQEAFESIEKDKPDLMIIELMHRNNDSIEQVRQIRNRYPQLPVLVFSEQTTDEYIQHVIGAGASGYICKREAGQTLLFALRKVLVGETYVGRINPSFDTGNNK